MELTYKVTLSRITKNYYVYEMGGGGFSVYFPKTDFNGDQPPKQATLTLSSR